MITTPFDIKGENKMTVEQAKKELLSTMESIDKDKLSLPDLRMYADILKIISEIQTKTFSEMMSETMNSMSAGFNIYKPPIISDMK